MTGVRQAGDLHTGPAAQKRPVGVKLLAVIAFAISAALGIAPIYMVFSFWRDRADNPQDLPAYAGIAITALCLLTLAIISAVAGVDLLKLRKRGRSLTIVSMFFIGLLGVLYTLLSINVGRLDIGFFCAGLTMSAVSVSAILYLRHAKVSNRFGVPSPPERD
jgi:hypothetical protein